MACARQPKCWQCCHCPRSRAAISIGMELSGVDVLGFSYAPPMVAARPSGTEGYGETAAERAKLASPADRRQAWEAWVAQVQLLFRAADDWWADAMPALADSRGRRGALWRRVIGVGR